MKLSIPSLFFLLITSQFSIAQNVGVNTKTPKSALDVNGDLIIRNVPLLGHNGDDSYFEIGIDNENRIITKNKEIKSYSRYLGFDPMAPSHTVKIPIKLEKNYITKFTGTSIGACYGVKVDFEIQFIDKKFISAVLQAYPLAELQASTVYDRVILTSKSNIFSQYLEKLANASACTDSGHIFSLDTEGNIVVTYFDAPTYFPNAGIFVIYNVEKTKYN